MTALEFTLLQIRIFLGKSQFSLKTVGSLEISDRGQSCLYASDTMIFVVNGKKKSGIEYPLAY